MVPGDEDTVDAVSDHDVRHLLDRFILFHNKDSGGHDVFHRDRRFIRKMKGIKVLVGKAAVGRVHIAVMPVVKLNALFRNGFMTKDVGYGNGAHQFTIDGYDRCT